MKKAYRIERQNGKGEWRPSAVYTDTYSAPEAISILHASEAAFVNYRMVWGYAPTTADVELHDETPISSVWVLAVRKYNGGADDVLGVFSTEEKATLHLGHLALTTGVDHDYEYEVVKFTIDKGR